MRARKDKVCQPAFQLHHDGRRFAVISPVGWLEGLLDLRTDLEIIHCSIADENDTHLNKEKDDYGRQGQVRRLMFRGGQVGR